MNKTTTSLPPISDIFRGPNITDPYYPQQGYSMYGGMSVVPHTYPAPQYQLATPEQVAPRYYNAPYTIPAYGFAGKTGYGDARDAWRGGVDVPHQLPSPTLYQSPAQLGHRGMSMSVGLSPLDYADIQTLSREMSPKSQHMAASGSKMRTRNNLPKEVTSVLLKWLNEHLNHPYPNSFEKAQLIIATGLNQQQLSNWFINARRRKIKSLREKRDSQSS
ncbi:hypothetical protein METBIDRAFT_10720 [Metschnikowia bicuspidata var. bicuspidata NRRL YB-4993]|uniref:Homeobox domain-containing protein n=1 Tax=Metschnikowia bicuspidata var. bicuspidata NRRL YB-4993 TaxID=869754 RepID=A0A1A0HCR0_9ASCO|nr:hypothetical protein METBIDRAFT_10720 [Metschnikowia bicuspidata var. bicuspidata NRRL YB-4993]OBA21791.1 hypothetical protein METBIDRAFT_10720 [Metschnikowia bicuspidata var. bicuspidata NRRL YB-4993]